MTVFASHAEVEAALRLAALGAGWPGGHADDLARATVALEHFGIAAVEAALSASQSPVEPLCNPVPGTSGQVLVGQVGSLGPAIADLLLAKAEKVQAKIVDEPALLAGYLWLAARRGAESYVRYEDGGEAWIGRDICLQGPRPASGAEAMIRLERIADRCPVMLHGELEIDERTWNSLMAARDRMLVPPSEESRARGAGPDA